MASYANSQGIQLLDRTVNTFGPIFTLEQIPFLLEEKWTGFASKRLYFGGSIGSGQCGMSAAALTLSAGGAPGRGASITEKIS